MTLESRETKPGRKERQETVTPFLERSISELVSLFVQIFTTPFAFLSYNRRFRDQITALAEDDLSSAYPETVARPLSFFVLLMGGHLLLSGVYWRFVLPGRSLTDVLHRSKPFAETADKLFGSVKYLADKVGNTEAFLIVAFAITLIIAAKGYFVAMSGRVLRCPVRFKTALHASAYAFGTFIFVQYIFILVRCLSALCGDKAFQISYGIIPYGSLIVAILLVVRTNYVIRQVDGTPELMTYFTWLLGTVIWHFTIVLGAIYLLNLGGLSDYWSIYSQFLSVLGNALYPPKWFEFSGWP